MVPTLPAEIFRRIGAGYGSRVAEEKIGKSVAGAARAGGILRLDTREREVAYVVAAVVAKPLVVPDENAELQRVTAQKEGEVVRGFKRHAVLRFGTLIEL